MPVPMTQRELIRQRASWRNYRPELLSAADGTALLARLAGPLRPPHPGAVRFALVESQAENPADDRKIGTYGNVRGARQFIVGAVRQGPRDLENYGYLLEELILFATGLGLGTCWLGGTFNRDGFAEKIGLAADELLPAVTPVGYVASERGIRDRFLRWQANSKIRKPREELLFLGDFSRPLPLTRAGAYTDALEAVRLAPSASNKQPWRVLAAENAPVYHFYLRRSALYAQAAKVLFSADDLQRVDLGIAMRHFEAVARELNLPGHWALEDPRLPELPERTEYNVTWVGEG